MTSKLTPKQRRDLDSAIDSLVASSKPQRIESFIAAAIGMTMAQCASLLSGSSLAEIIAHITERRESLLRNSAELPSYVIYHDPAKAMFISGLNEYLNLLDPAPSKLKERIAFFEEIKTALLKFQKGHHLEALTAAILQEMCDFSVATQGSGDQGIDVVAWRRLLMVNRCFVDGDITKEQPLPGERVFVLASCKSTKRLSGSSSSLVNPAAIRELVGGWIIQRSVAGTWGSHGISPMSPVQMLFATTHRLSEDAKAECRQLGVHVWGVPELVYLICHTAPDNVFPKTPKPSFSLSQFNKWWEPKHLSRQSAIQ